MSMSKWNVCAVQVHVYYSLKLLDVHKHIFILKLNPKFFRVPYLLDTLVSVIICKSFNAEVPSPFTYRTSL